MNMILVQDIPPAWTPDTVIGHRKLTLVPLRGEGHQARTQDWLVS
jgi:hypothetical protein